MDCEARSDLVIQFTVTVVISPFTPDAPSTLVILLMQNCGNAIEVEYKNLTAWQNPLYGVRKLHVWIDKRNPESC